MNGQDQPGFFRIIRPYLFISLSGILAFAPVSFMLKALKNDIVAIEYPINYFISQCIHNAEIPYWFNTWGMGFPLQSNLTWGIYSTPQVLFSTFFDYNIYVLHIEFMFFILLSGWGMFYLLREYLVKDEKPALVLSICYMLSGFTVGSSQWLLYITAAAFIPLVTSSLLRLLSSPSFRNAMQFAVIYFLMFTSVYAAFNIITTYSLAAFLLIYLSAFKRDKRDKFKLLFYLVLAGLLTALLCLPCLYYTLELLKYMDRGNAIAGTEFFNSNYLHPSGLSSMLLPFSSVKMNFPNTEGTMLDSYAGLFTLLFLPFAILKIIREKNRGAIILLFAALFFLFLSFGATTPLRKMMNILPGFSYFRNPGIFRLYFLLALIFFISTAIRSISFDELWKNIKKNRLFRFTFLTLTVICLITLLFNIRNATGLSFTSLNETKKNLSQGQAFFISSAIQLFLLAALFFLVQRQRFRFAGILFIGDMMINALICTPYFTVSSYSLPMIDKILFSEKEFPVQNEKPGEAATTFTDNKANTWYNTNVYRKKVSSKDSYRGPLTLRQFSGQSSDTFFAKHFFDNPVVFAGLDSITKRNKIIIVLQHPTHIRVSANLAEAATVTALQNYFPGWKAYYNDKPVELINKDKPGLTITVPKGNGTIDFIYEKKGVWLSALLLHFIAISFLVLQGFGFIKRMFFKPSPLS